MDRYRRLVSFIFILSAGSPLLAQTKPLIHKHDDIPFAEVDGITLKLDLARPSSAGPHPCVVCWHGGAWKAGSRKDLSRPGLIDFGLGEKSLLEALASQGYVAVSASYRLLPQHRWPAMIQDAKTVIRYLRANAEKYGIDPNRIAAAGFSAGGHLASLVGTATDVPEFEGSLYSQHSSRVQCVVDFFGPKDLTLYTLTPGIEKSFITPLFGGPSNEKLQEIKKASPITHVSKSTVPFLIMHGMLDVVVPIKHSDEFQKRLAAAGVPAEYIRLPYKGHGWFGAAAAESVNTMIKFLNSQLQKK